MTMDWELGRAQGGRYPTVATQQQPKNGDVKYEMNAAGYLEEWQYQASSGINPFTGEMESGGWKRIAAYNMPGSGGSTGATWKPGEQEQEESKLTLSWLKYQSDLLKDQQSALSDEWQNAVMEGDLKRQMAADAEIKRNNAEINRLNAQRNAIEVYSSQLTSRASLASTAANVATTASEWAANPRNEAALLKLQETGLLGGSATPLNAAQYNPETMGAYGTALDQRFQDLFGGVGKQLTDALAATNETPAAAKPWYEADPNYASTLNPNQQAVVRNYTPEERTQYLNFMNMTPEQKKYVIGAGTPSMAGGGKMTVNEPTGLVGLISKKLYATIAEDAPEQVTITPMKQPKQGEGGGIPGVQSFAGGGTINAWNPKGQPHTGNRPDQLMSATAVRNLVANYNKPGPMRRHAIDYAAGKTSYAGRGLGWTSTEDPATGRPWPRERTRATNAITPTTGAATAATADTPEMKLAKQFALTLKPLGIDYTPTPGNYAPPPNLLVGTPWARLQKYPSILAMLQGMASLSGEPWGDFSSEVNMFQPTAPRYPSVSYGW